MQLNHDTLHDTMTVTENLKLPKILKDKHTVTMKALFAQNFNRFFHAIDRKLQQLFEAGLIDYNTRYWFDRRDPRRNFVESGPQVLTLEELEAGFAICILPLILSAFVFVVEWMVTFKDLLITQIIFESFLRWQHRSLLIRINKSSR